MALADVNGDGKLDSPVANACNNNSSCNNGSVGVLLGNGDGTYQAATAYSSAGLYADGVAVGISTATATLTWLSPMSVTGIVARMELTESCWAMAMERFKPQLLQTPAD